MTDVGPTGVDGILVTVDLLPPGTDVVMDREGAKKVTGVGPTAVAEVSVTANCLLPPGTMVVTNCGGVNTATGVEPLGVAGVPVTVD